MTGVARPILALVALSFLIEGLSTAFVHLIATPKGAIIGSLMSVFVTGSLLGFWSGEWLQQPTWYRFSIALIASGIGWATLILILP